MRPYNRLPGETDEQLIYRITSDKDLIGTWQKVADILNEILNTNYTESKFRKQRQNFDKMFVSNQEVLTDNDEVLQEIKNERIALEKAKVQFRDERNEYRRILREEARKESYGDMLCRLLQEHVTRCPEHLKKMDVKPGDNDLIIHLTDIHYGIDSDNYFNKYNEDVLWARLDKYLTEIDEIRNRHKSENAYVIISEVISGLIHENLRCENNENVIDQFLTVSDYIAEFLNVLAHDFAEVHAYVCPGNHSRVSAKKSENLKGENFDNLLIPFLSAKLQNVDNIFCHKNMVDEGICMFEVRGNTIMGSHGDKDSPNNVVEKFSLLFRTIPDIVYLGHRHTNGMRTVYNTKVIESGCVSGADNYAIDHRLFTPPEQTVSVIDHKGLSCLYDIQLS